MRVGLGHRLPGGFYGGVSTRLRRPPVRRRSSGCGTSLLGALGCGGWIFVIFGIGLAVDYPVPVFSALAGAIVLSIGVAVLRRSHTPGGPLP